MATGALNVFRSVSAELTTEDKVIYTAPEAYTTIVLSAQISNVSNTKANATFTYAANVPFANSNSVSSISVNNPGSNAVGLPTVTILGANSQQATANVAAIKLVGIHITNPGTGYQFAESLRPTGGVNTQTAIVTVTSVDGFGAVTGVSIQVPGKYITVPTLVDNDFISNTSAIGTGFTANLFFGIESVNVLTSGNNYNPSTVTAQASGNGITNSVLSVNLAPAFGWANTELIKNYDIPGYDAASALVGKLVIETGNQIKVKSSANNKLKLVLSVLESSNE